MSNLKSTLPDLVYEKDLEARRKRYRAYQAKWRKKHPGYKKAWDKANWKLIAAYQLRTRDSRKAYQAARWRNRKLK